MKFKRQIAFNILTLHHQILRDITCVLYAIIIFIKTVFLLLCRRTTTSNKLNRCKTLVFVVYERKNTLLS